MALVELAEQNGAQQVLVGSVVRLAEQRPHGVLRDAAHHVDAVLAPPVVAHQLAVHLALAVGVELVRVPRAELLWKPARPAPVFLLRMHSTGKVSQLVTEGGY